MVTYGAPFKKYAQTAPSEDGLFSFIFHIYEKENL
jgi:hypothetical protein